MPFPRRILLLSHLFPRETSPHLGLYAFNLATHLAVKDVLVITRHFQSPLQNANLAFQVKQIRYPNSQLQLISSGRTSKLLGYAQSGLGQAMLALKAIPPAKQFQPDVIHSVGALTLPAALSIRQFTGAPAIVSLEGTDFQRIKRSKVLIRWLGLADKIIALSAEMYDFLSVRFPPHKIAQIPAGVDLSTFAPCEDRERLPMLITIGRLVPAKRYDRLLQSVQQVFRQYPDYKLLIMGEGPLRPALEQQSQALGIQDKVKFGGVVEKQKLASLLCQSKAFVMSSQWEGTPKSLFEALACGTPAVVTDVGECAQIVGNAGRVAQSQQPDDLADAIIQVITSRNWEKLSQEAVAVTSRFSWKHVSEQIDNLYEAVYSKEAHHRP